VLIDRDGKIASPIAIGAVDVLALARATTPDAVVAAIAAFDAAPADGGAAPERAPGEVAPAFSLPDLDGRRVSLDDFRSHPTVVLFWNPECGFCQRLLPELIEWEQDREEDDPRLLVVSTGTAEQNRAQGFSSTVLLDQGFSVGSSFGASGTPAGILIDADGRIASAVAVGGPGVLALLEGEELDAASLSNDDPVIGLRVGTPAPDLELPDLDGRPVRLSSFRGQPTLVVFWSPTCGFCQALLPRFRAWEESQPADAPRVLIVSSGDVDENRAFGFRSPLVIDDDSVAHKAFRSWSTPTAILIDADGRVASAPAEGARALLALANGEDPEAAAAVDDDGTVSLPIGSPAPVVELPDLAGARVSTASLRGTRTLAVFWNPECGYCQRMMPDLLEWEANRRPDDPRLLLISRGGAERNRDQGFSATILLDDDFAGMAAFGVNGTPSAILIDADGKVASDLAVGADEIFDLIPAPAAAIAEPAARGGRFARLFKGSGAGGA
jgi:thiol-disulfide isomerase/thioredoxin